MSTSANIPLDGYCDPRFTGVRDALANNMVDGFEIGAAVCVTLEGETVVDLWTGYRDAARTQPWQRNTITTMRSVVKAMGALCVLRLVGQGKLELDKPLANYWPAFGQNGKQDITVRCVVAHLAGLPFADAAPRGSMFTPGVVEAALEVQKPEWEPGTQGCYHSFTYPMLMAGIVRHASGRTMHEYFRDEIATPLGAEYFIGLDEDQFALCAEHVVTPGTPSLEGMKRNTASPLYRAWTPLPLDETYNSANWLGCGYTGHGNPRGAARIFAVLANGGSLNGYTLLEPEILAEAVKCEWDMVDFMTKRVFRMGLGLLLPSETITFGGGPNNFGHPGLGGSLVFADPDRRMSFSYCPNRMAPIADAGPYATALMDATYAALR